MVQNIAIVCHKHGYARGVAATLAERLEMNWFDAFDMLLFDDKPRTLTETLEILGSREVRKHEEKVIGYAADFENAIIVCESGAVESKKNWDTLKKTCVIVYLHCSPERIFHYNEKETYASPREKKFFFVDKDRYKNRIEICKQNADIVVNCTKKSTFLSASLTIRELQKFFGN